MNTMLTTCNYCGASYPLANRQLHNCLDLPQSWQQDTRTKSDFEQSSSLGIYNLEAAHKQIHALRLTVAGICSNLLTSSPPNIGPEVTEDLATVDASFVRLRNDMDALLHTATDVLNGLKR